MNNPEQFKTVKQSAFLVRSRGNGGLPINVEVVLPTNANIHSGMDEITARLYALTRKVAEEPGQTQVNPFNRNIPTPTKP